MVFHIGEFAWVGLHPEYLVPGVFDRRTLYYGTVDLLEHRFNPAHIRPRLEQEQQSGAVVWGGLASSVLLRQEDYAQCTDNNHEESQMFHRVFLLSMPWIAAQNWQSQASLSQPVFRRYSMVKN
jgi:hypothetical protein